MTTNGVRKAQLVIATVALVSGIIGYLAAASIAFTAAKGAILGSLMSFNRLGAVISIVLAALALVGVKSGAKTLVAGAGGGFLLAAVVQLIQAGASTNLLGGRPSTFSFFLAVGAGLVVLAVPPGMVHGRQVQP